ncbi:class I SAM-dependent methyltransferase [Candidatus Sumerlaeota bacterium]|nr:class I SAM-dependent methyltransferase [Candidatus Sumerlaeota bacterium]
MANLLHELYERDRGVWDACAATYEERIVHGHPDVTAYEEFEEDLLDRLLLFLARDCEKDLALYDVGCGSGRLHLRYACQSVVAEELGAEEQKRLLQARRDNPKYAYEPYIAQRLRSIGGIDFSHEMLELAAAKLRAAGLGELIGQRCGLDQGSAFKLAPFASAPLPVVVSVCNSIGVMQGEVGAQALFQSMARTVAESGGIAIISAYRRETVADFALGNYESTMDVCGQPRWLKPETHSTQRQVPRLYKRAYDKNPSVVVDVYDEAGNLIQENHTLMRDEQLARQTVETGQIRTHSGYESNWYSWEQFEEWIAAYWPAGQCYHLAGKSLDALRGAPAQFAVLDASGLLAPLLQRWNKEA